MGNIFSGIPTTCFPELESPSNVVFDSGYSIIYGEGLKGSFVSPELPLTGQLLWEALYPSSLLLQDPVPNFLSDKYSREQGVSDRLTPSMLNSNTMYYSFLGGDVVNPESCIWRATATGTFPD